MDRYMLEVYSPDENDVVLVSLTSNTPFLAIARGDVFDPQVWGADGQTVAPDLLEAVRVDHLVWASGAEVYHKVMVRTRAISR